MPILTPDRGPLENVQLTLDLASQLPEIADIRATGGHPNALDVAAREWRRRTGIVWQQAAQQTLGGIVANVGIPVHEMRRIGGELVNVYSAVVGGFDVKTAAISIAKQLATDLELENTLANTAGALGEKVASAVPIIGAVVRLVVSVTRIAVRVARAEKGKFDKPIYYQRSGFLAAQDSAFYADSFAHPLQNTRDWTNIFSPPGWELRMGQVKHTFAKHELDEGDGWRVTMIEGQGGLGQIPGENWLHQSIEFYGSGPGVDPGQYLPTANQQATFLWAQLQSQGPSIMCVDAAAVGARWADYLFYLRRWLHESGKLSTKQQDRVIDFLRPAVGWRARPRGRSSGDAPTWENLDVESFAPVQAAERLRKAQRAALDTLTCAYVDESYEAIMRDKPLELQWEHRRRQLLEHRARFAVDLDNVPDQAYRAELMRRGVPDPRAGAGGFQAEGGTKPEITERRGGGLRIGGGRALVVADEGDGPVLRPTEDEPDPIRETAPYARGGGAGPALLVAGTLGAAAAAKARGMF